MNLQELIAEALHLSMEERAHLIQQLVLSMESPSEDELKAEWIKEAHRKANELTHLREQLQVGINQLDQGLGTTINSHEELDELFVTIKGA
ncbi:hypothetical protein Selin_2564 [Desulfurispirillum indicum S5]|uniref:Addiction module component CHP02574 family protein n=2 Tax=Desulfurispirillum TaxID=393029 RepID=E6W6E1_DESIS|nr:hypothetical protein Selin_2564 [Desulfurispirillum indicum S5]